ncbi:hypothetical protein DMH26_21470 [Streptomyces sp. WAC 05379]|nr:hypothetical protein DMH26_21470 [Streptomyces sp. WAC 05379]
MRPGAVLVASFMSGPELRARQAVLVRSMRMRRLPGSDVFGRQGCAVPAELGGCVLAAFMDELPRHHIQIRLADVFVFYAAGVLLLLQWLPRSAAGRGAQCSH